MTGDMSDISLLLQLVLSNSAFKHDIISDEDAIMYGLALRMVLGQGFGPRRGCLDRLASASEKAAERLSAITGGSGAAVSKTDKLSIRVTDNRLNGTTGVC